MVALRSSLVNYPAIKMSYPFYRELVAELPFTLMHPKPEEDRPSSSSGSHKSEASTKENGEEKAEKSDKDKGAGSTADPLVDTNLIQLDT